MRVSGFVTPTNIGTASSRFAGCIHPSRNFDMVLLMEEAERFDFIVDVRGPYPTMIKGMKAAQYRSHRDLLNFISITHGGTLHLSGQF